MHTSRGVFMSPGLQKAYLQRWVKGYFSSIKCKIHKSIIYIEILHSISVLIIYQFILGGCNIKCQNGGECWRKNKCKCKKGYKGKDCSIRKQYLFFSLKYFKNDLTDIFKGYVDLCHMNVNWFEFIVLCFIHSGLSAQVQ